MKRLVSVVLCVALVLSFFTGCTNNKDLTLMQREGKIKVGLVAYEDNEDVSEAKKGFETALADLKIDKKIQIEYKNAKGDVNALHKICSDIFDNNDLVVTIGEAASVVAGAEREDTTKPIFFIGVNNPITASLMTNTITPSRNITGVMSKITPDCIFSFAVEKIGGQLRKVGIIYNTSDINAAYEINELKDYLNSNSIKYFEGVIANGFDAQQAALEIAGAKVPALDGSKEKVNPRTVYVISNDEISKNSIESISTIINGVNAVAFVLGEAELPSKNFNSILPDYNIMGYQCVSLINDYINGIDILAIPARSSEGYRLIQYEGEDGEETEVLTEEALTEEEEITTVE